MILESHVTFLTHTLRAAGNCHKDFPLLCGAERQRTPSE